MDVALNILGVHEDTDNNKCRYHDTGDFKLAHGWPLKLKIRDGGTKLQTGPEKVIHLSAQKAASRRLGYALCKKCL